MDYLLYGLAGALGGILGGMGMGGGTVLIPLLTILFGTSQLGAQAVNLISFIPMAAVALAIHLKNKFVDFKGSLFVIIPGVAACVGGCFLARAIGGELLRKIFGGFLLVLSVYQIIQVFVKSGK